jgi:mono/diheme cytochrome c family protein
MMDQPPPPPRRRMWPVQWLSAWIIGGVLAGACGLAVVELGLYDVRATQPHDAVIAWAIHTTMIRSVRLRAGEAPSFRTTPDEVEAGFRLYDADCSVCHGGPSVSRANWVSGMNPTPPYLVDAAHRWTPAQLHFIIAGGVKMTGMPGWSTTLSDRQVWDLVSFLKAMPYISGRDYQQMRTTNDKR